MNDCFNTVVYIVLQTSNKGFIEVQAYVLKEKAEGEPSAG